MDLGSSRRLQMKYVNDFFSIGRGLSKQQLQNDIANIKPVILTASHKTGVKQIFFIKAYVPFSQFFHCNNHCVHQSFSYIKKKLFTSLKLISALCVKIQCSHVNSDSLLFCCIP